MEKGVRRETNYPIKLPWIKVESLKIFYYDSGHNFLFEFICE